MLCEGIVFALYYREITRKVLDRREALLLSRANILLFRGFVSPDIPLPGANKNAGPIEQRKAHNLTRFFAPPDFILGRMTLSFTEAE